MIWLLRNYISHRIADYKQSIVDCRAKDIDLQKTLIYIGSISLLKFSKENLKPSLDLTEKLKTTINIRGTTINKDIHTMYGPAK